MANLLRGYTAHDITQHARGEIGRRVVNFNRALPQGATVNIFTVSAPVLVTALFGVVGTVFGAATKLQIGVTGTANAIAAQPAAGATAAAGTVIVPPTTIGGQLPAPVAASGAAAGSGLFVVNAAAITLTADTSTTGNITWVLEYVNLSLKLPATVAAV